MNPIFYFAAATAAISFCDNASAQSFTSTTTISAPMASVGGVRDDGTAYGAMATTNTGETTTEGKTTKATGTCIRMSQPPRDAIFDFHVMCNNEDAMGTWTISLGCSDLGSNIRSCVGNMRGLTGAYAKRKGNIATYGEGQTSTAAGQWFK